jgi:hypothetical protein
MYHFLPVGRGIESKIQRFENLHWNYRCYIDIIENKFEKSSTELWWFGLDRARALFLFIASLNLGSSSSLGSVPLLGRTQNYRARSDPELCLMGDWAWFMLKLDAWI